LEQAGAIDLVTGFGSVRKLPIDELNDPSEENHNPTAPRVIRNTRGKKEVYKTPYKSQKTDNPREGDPDFARDLSRFYLAMKTKGDLNFKIQLSGPDGLYPDSRASLVQETKKSVENTGLFGHSPDKFRDRRRYAPITPTSP
jgi:hypothetical protein